MLTSLLNKKFRIIIKMCNSDGVHYFKNLHSSLFSNINGFLWFLASLRSKSYSEICKIGHFWQAAISSICFPRNKVHKMSPKSLTSLDYFSSTTASANLLWSQTLKISKWNSNISLYKGRAHYLCLWKSLKYRHSVSEKKCMHIGLFLFFPKFNKVLFTSMFQFL